MKAIDGRQLRAGRMILGLTMQQMGEAADINRNSVLRVEGKKRLPRHCWAGERISEFLEQEGVMFDADGDVAVIRFASDPTRRKAL